LDRIRDSNVTSLIERISRHYQTNISNRFIRPLLLQLQLDKNTWDQIELLTEKTDTSSYHGFHLDELYRQIAACARFVEVARSGLIPNIKNKLAAAPPSGSDKILREMAASNFVSNLQVFADLLNELYISLVNIEKQSTTKKQPLYNQIPELSSVGRILSSR